MYQQKSMTSNHTLEAICNAELAGVCGGGEGDTPPPYSTQVDALHATGRVLKSTVTGVVAGAGTGALIGTGVGLVGGPAAPVTVPGGAAAGAVYGAWFGGMAGFGKGIWDELRRPRR